MTRNLAQSIWKSLLRTLRENLWNSNWLEFKSLIWQNRIKGKTRSHSSRMNLIGNSSYPIKQIVWEPRFMTVKSNVIYEVELRCTSLDSWAYSSTLTIGNVIKKARCSESTDSWIQFLQFKNFLSSLSSFISSYISSKCSLSAYIVALLSLSLHWICLFLDYSHKKFSSLLA